MLEFSESVMAYKFIEFFASSVLNYRKISKSRVRSLLMEYYLKIQSPLDTLALY